MPNNTPSIRGDSRFFIIENRAGPANVPQFYPDAYAGSLDKTFGSTTRIEVPSQTRRGAYDAVRKFKSGEEGASLPLMVRHKLTLSALLDLARRGCPFDIQVHFGQCTDPRDYAAGWHSGKIIVLEDVDANSYSTDDLGAMASGDEDAIMETLETTALDLYEIAPMSFSEKAASAVAQEIITVLVCDGVECGDCDDPSDGCQKVFAVSAPAGSSPGLLPEVIVSTDGLSNVAQESPITTLAAGQDPSDAACVGAYLVVISQTSVSLHYADLDELVAGTETWIEVATGFVAGGAPIAIHSHSPFDTWIVGAGGYVYKTEDPTVGVVVQDAGTTTTNQLNDVTFFDLDNGVAVGNTNTVIYTTDGGATWQSVTGPDTVGTPHLLSVGMRREKEWWVGTNDGKLWYTVDRGVNWTQKEFPGDATGNIRDIVWASDTVGFFAHDAANVGYILRTTSGGYSWSRFPDGNSSLIANDKINSLAICEKEVNKLYAGGLADNAADGILLKGTA